MAAQGQTYKSYQHLPSLSIFFLFVGWDERREAFFWHINTWSDDFFLKNTQNKKNDEETLGSSY